MTTRKRIVVCATQVPFLDGGAEAFGRGLVEQLRRRGHRAELVALPFKWYPPREIPAHAAAWRLLDLSESGGERIDLVVATRFPSYFVRHPRKVAWLVHQYRPAYDLCGTGFSEFTHDDRDVGLRATLMRLDREMLQECRQVFAISRNVAARLERFNGLRATPLYHPPPLADRLAPGPGGDCQPVAQAPLHSSGDASSPDCYVLSVGQLLSIKRVDLAVRAMRAVRAPVRLVVAGEGRERPGLERLAAETGVADRVEFRGRVGDAALAELYAGALAVLFLPRDEDYGYVTLEAFLAARPVITARDSGGTLEFVEDGVTGLVCDPRPEALGAAVDRLAGDRARAAALGAAGRERVRGLSWDHVVDTLIGAAER